MVLLFVIPPPQNASRTETIDSLPIKIFAAFFTASEEEIVQEGIDVANDGAGYTLYELTDTWADDLRVIYKVDNVKEDNPFYENVLGVTNRIRSVFTKAFADAIHVDWAIQIKATSVEKWIVAHELGHASGINSHELIDYENNTLIPLEENSLMSDYVASLVEPELNDYNFMMQMQGELIQQHLGANGLECRVIAINGFLDN